MGYIIAPVLIWLWLQQRSSRDRDGSTFVLSNSKIYSERVTQKWWDNWWLTIANTQFDQNVYPMEKKFHHLEWFIVTEWLPTGARFLPSTVAPIVLPYEWRDELWKSGIGGNLEVWQGYSTIISLAILAFSHHLVMVDGKRDLPTEETHWLVLWNHGILWLSRNSWEFHHPNWHMSKFSFATHGHIAGLCGGERGALVGEAQG